LVIDGRKDGQRNEETGQEHYAFTQARLVYA